MIKEWWQSYTISGSPDFILVQKQRCLKKDITTWNKEVYGKLENRRSKALENLALLDQIDISVPPEEKLNSFNLKLELQHIALAEEISWR